MGTVSRFGFSLILILSGFLFVLAAAHHDWTTLLFGAAGALISCAGGARLALSVTEMVLMILETQLRSESKKSLSPLPSQPAFTPQEPCAAPGQSPTPDAG